ncbi:MAG: ABC transporter ATP-binding protein [Caldilineae bacterium]|nr:MAG: ABC transporter ATP-binding protein [Caldilineae bacterium]
MLEIENIHSYYGGAHVLHGVSLVVPDNAVIALLGRNGMGKTTLLRSVMGTTPPHVREGSIRYRGEELVGKPPFQIASLGLGLVPQGRRIFPSLTVLENLTMASRPPAKTQNGSIVWDLERVYNLFPRLAERKKHFGNQLSGGELQMLAIGRALMTNPSLLLMDEPSEGLAPLLVQQLRDQLLELKAAGLPMLLVEQNLGMALAVADEVYIMESGKIVYHGKPEELEAAEDIKYRYLGV